MREWWNSLEFDRCLLVHDLQFCVKRSAVARLGSSGHQEWEWPGSRQRYHAGSWRKWRGWLCISFLGGSLRSSFAAINLMLKGCLQVAVQIWSSVNQGAKNECFFHMFIFSYIFIFHIFISLRLVPPEFPIFFIYFSWAFSKTKIYTKDGATVRFVSALVAPVVPLTVMLCCILLELLKPGSGINAGLQAQQIKIHCFSVIFIVFL